MGQLNSLKYYPLSQAQMRMWFSVQFSGDPQAYLVPFLLNMTGKVNAVYLEKSIKKLTQRHEMLRANLVNVEGEIHQIIKPASNTVFSVVNIKETDIELARSKATQAAIEEGCRPLNLFEDPLFRAVFYQINPNESLLLLALHHLITDGVSMNILLEDLGHIYSTYVNDTAVNLPEIENRYLERAVQSVSEIKSEKAYWADTLHGVKNISWPKMPLSEGREKQIEFHEFIIPKKTVTELRKVAAGRSVSLFTLLFSSYRVLLDIYLEQDDVLIGVPTAGRPIDGADGVVGLFVNTLPIRLKIDENEKFDEYIEKTGRALQQARLYQELPIDEILRSIEKGETSKNRPRIQSIFNYRSFRATAFEAIGIDVSIRRHPIPPKDMDLAFHVEKMPDGLLCRVDFSNLLFDDIHVQNMTETYRGILESAIEDVHKQISEVALISCEEKKLQIAWGKGPDIPLELNNIVEAFFESAKMFLDRQAITGKKNLSYQEMASDICRLTLLLDNWGVKAGSRVVLSLSRTSEQVSVIFAILNLRACFIPLPADWPVKRKESLIKEIKPSLVISDSVYSGVKVPQMLMSELLKESQKTNIIGTESFSKDVKISSDDIAYILFTSGSTGKPKGVQIRHDSLVNQIFWFNRNFKIDEHCKILARTPFSFDASIWELFCPFAAGATMVLADERETRESMPLNRLLRACNVTHLQCVPSLLNVLIECGAFKDVSTLRRVFCGGEPLTLNLVQRIREVTGARVINLYGPTETTVQISSDDVTEEIDNITIGKPIDNVSLFVLNKHNKLTPIGCKGELCVVGLPVSAGYLGEQNSGKFIRDPMGSCQRAYKTGDLVQWLRNGKLQYLGREDSQIKIRGQRVEIEEIERSILMESNILDVSVYFEKNDLGESLYAFLVESSSEIVDIALLRKSLMNRLQPAAVPGMFIKIDALPLLENGKVSQKRLAALVKEHSRNR